MSAVQQFDKYREMGAYHWSCLDKPHSKYRMRVDAVCEKLRPHDRCLDLGCGDGAYMYCVARKCRHVVGVDADPDGIRCAHEELTRHGVQNYTLVHASFGELRGRLPASMPRYDLVYSVDVIEHLHDPEELLDLMARHVRPGGTVIVGTPLFIRAEEVSPYHIKEFTVEEMRRLLRPRFVMTEERYLPASLPKSKEVLPRYYMFFGKPRRWWHFGRA
jgi:2-polyprenyl-3-methyl-5-hydroxy-6-metoxy-1,4-benzoquinol methylase